MPFLVLSSQVRHRAGYGACEGWPVFFFVEVLRFGRSCFQAGVQHRGSSGQGNEDVVSVRERHPGLPLRRIA